MTNLVILLKKQHALLDQLAGLLENELHLISSRDAETLTKVVNQKSQLLDEIAEVDSAIKASYTEANHPEEDEQLTTHFEAIRVSVEQCKFRTEINQKAVEQGQLRLEHLRNLLLEARSKESMTYDRSGKPKGGRSGKGVSA